MKKSGRLLIFLLFFLLAAAQAQAYSPDHHLVNMGRDLLNVIASPVKAALKEGPKDIRKMYTDEVYGREKPEKNGLLRYKLFALLRAPAVELKAIIDGAVRSVSHAGSFCKELLSIPFSD